MERSQLPTNIHLRLFEWLEWRQFECCQLGQTMVPGPGTQCPDHNALFTSSVLASWSPTLRHLFRRDSKVLVPAVPAAWEPDLLLVYLLEVWLTHLESGCLWHFPLWAPSWAGQPGRDNITGSFQCDRDLTIKFVGALPSPVTLTLLEIYWIWQIRCGTFRT